MGKTITEAMEMTPEMIAPTVKRNAVTFSRMNPRVSF